MNFENTIKQVVDFAVVRIMRCFVYQSQSIEKTIHYIKNNTLVNNEKFDLTVDNIRYIETYVYKIVDSLDINHRCLFCSLARCFIYKEFGLHSIVNIGAIYRNGKIFGHAWLEMQNSEYNTLLIDYEKGDQKRVVITKYAV